VYVVVGGARQRSAIGAIRVNHNLENLWPSSNAFQVISFDP